MVFMGNGRSEDRHDAVAQHLVYRAFKAMHSLHHDVDGRIEKFLRLFRVQVGDQLGRVFDVGKADGHLLAFAFQGTAGGEDFLCEMLRCVGDGWRVWID